MKRAVGDRDRFIKFYPSDWRGDDELRACSLAARGAWVELMCLAHKYGGVVLIAGEVPPEADIAKQIGATKGEAAKLIAELERRGVASRREDGALFSRRMVRDAKRREINKANGEKGGNPSLFDSDNESVGKSVNRIANQTANPQRPETRDQNPEPKKEGLSSPETLAVAWNELTAEPIAACQELSARRKRAAQARLSERSLEEWRDVIGRISRSSFCRGQNDRGWVASFDWLLRPDTAVKVLEGQYDNRGPTHKAKPITPPVDMRYLARQLGPGSWASECVRLHDGRCGGSNAHAERMAVPA